MQYAVAIEISACKTSNTNYLLTLMHGKNMAANLSQPMHKLLVLIEFIGSVNQDRCNPRG